MVRRMLIFCLCAVSICKPMRHLPCVWLQSCPLPTLYFPSPSSVLGTLQVPALRYYRRHIVAGLVPLCLLVVFVSDRAGRHVPVELLSRPIPLQAAADLELAARLELAAESSANGGVSARSQMPSGVPHKAVFETTKQHDSAPLKGEHNVQLSGKDARSDMQSYFDSFTTPPAPTLEGFKPKHQATSHHELELEARISKQDAVIKDLKREVRAFEASMSQQAAARASKQGIADTPDAAVRKQPVAAVAAERGPAPVQKQEQHKQQAVTEEHAQLEHAHIERSPKTALQAARASAEQALRKAIADDSADLKSPQQLTKNLAKLLEPHHDSKRLTRSALPPHRNEFGIPVLNAADQGRLPGVNVADWVDPRVARAVAPAAWRSTHPLRGDWDGLDGAEGGQQLASVGIPAPAKAAACPVCAFNTDCSINIAARGLHRASGLRDGMPPYHGAVTPYGGGGAHMSSLHSTTTILPGGGSNEPLWDKLQLGDAVGAEELLQVQHGALQSAEGGEQLASVAIPKPKVAPQDPVPQVTLNPRPPPSTLHPTPSPRNPETRHSKPLNPMPCCSLNPQARPPQTCAPHPVPKTQNPEPKTQNPKPKTRAPHPETAAVAVQLSLVQARTGAGGSG
jgi:hypothetical protein